MTQPRTLIALTLTLSLPLALMACGAPDEAALAKGDAAFKGQTVGGVLAPVAARPVLVGKGGAQAAACSAMVEPKAGPVNVYWSASKDGPPKATLSAPALSCDSDGAWSGLVFAADGQSVSDCNLARKLRNPLEYQGPCRSGWVESAAVKPAG